MFESMYKHFNFTEEQLDAFINDFVLGLPEYMQTNARVSFYNMSKNPESIFYTCFEFCHMSGLNSLTQNSVE